MSIGRMVKVRIPNWEKFNPRSDRANYTWFRFQNEFFHDQRVFALTDSQQVLLAFTMCEISKKNGEAVDLLLSYVSAIRKQGQDQILEDYQALRDIGLLEVEFGGKLPSSRRHDDAKEPSSLPATNETYERNERDETRRTEQEPAVADGPPPPESLCEIWNDHSGDLPKVQRLTSKRKKSATARLRDNPDLDYWVGVVKRLAQSKFCNGEKGWRADFDFLLQPDTHVKASEGKYDNRKGAGLGSKAQQTTDNLIGLWQDADRREKAGGDL